MIRALIKNMCALQFNTNRLEAGFTQLILTGWKPVLPKSRAEYEAGRDWVIDRNGQEAGATQSEYIFENYSRKGRLVVFIARIWFCWLRRLIKMKNKKIFG